MAHLEASSTEDHRTVGSRRLEKLESSLVSGAAEGSIHQIDQLADGPCPTGPEISRLYPFFK